MIPSSACQTSQSDQSGPAGQRGGLPSATPRPGTRSTMAPKLRRSRPLEAGPAEVGGWNEVASMITMHVSQEPGYRIAPAKTLWLRFDTRGLNRMCSLARPRAKIAALLRTFEALPLTVWTGSGVKIGRMDAERPDSATFRPSITSAGVAARHRIADLSQAGEFHYRKNPSTVGRDSSSSTNVK